GESWADLAGRASRLGFRGVAVPFDPAWTDADLLVIRQACDEVGIRVDELACPCNLVTPRDEEAKEVFEQLQQALEAGAILNCDHVVTTTGSRHPDPSAARAPHRDNWSDATWDLLVRRIWALLEAVEDIGVCLCLEPTVTSTLNSLDQLADLTADASSVRVRIVLDPAAIFTPLAARHPRLALAEIFGRLTDTIVLARATDVALIEAGPEPTLEPVTLGQGALDYVTYLKLLDALELDTPLVVKRQPTDEAYEAAHQFLAAQAREAGVAL
ncbi:MAG: sugar phosphate isomerase/epimerase family protein, partial [Planctomycetota bacterium]